MRPSEWNNLTNEERMEHRREKRWVSTNVRNSMVTIAIFVVVLLVAISLSSPPATVDAKEIETIIRKGIREQTGLASRVQCPDGIEREAGRKFTCSVDTGIEQDVVFDVTIGSDEDEVTVSRRGA